MRSLQHQLRELASVKTAPALWRQQTRERLLTSIKLTASRPLMFGEAVSLRVSQVRLFVAQLRLVPVVVTVLLLAVAYTPFSWALSGSLPGSALYPVKRTVEKVELSLRSSSSSQGLFYLTLASRRLHEAAAVGTQAQVQAALLRDYNITLGFAAASLETGLPSTSLARAYDAATDTLSANLNQLQPVQANLQVFRAAQDLTSKVSARALALLVSAHVEGTNGLPQIEVANRLTAEITKAETKLAGVDVKIREFPAVKSAPKVVIGSPAAVVPAAEAQQLAKDNLAEAKELVARNEFSLALQKLTESEAITEQTEAAVTEETAAGEEGTVPVEGEEVAPPDGSVEGESTETGTGEEAPPEEQPDPSAGAGSEQTTETTPAP